MDLVDELLREGLLGRDGRVLDDLADLAGQLGEVGGGRQGLDGAGRQGLLEFQLAGLQLGDLGAEGLDALAALGLWQGAGLERAQVALDRGFGLVDLGADRGEFPLGAVAGVGGLAADGAGCLLGEVGAGEGVQQGRQDGLVELVGGQSFRRAGLLAVALEGEAGVVAVAVPVAVDGVADVVQAAVVAEDLAGQQVLGGVGCAGSAVLAAFFEQPLGGLEGGGVDQGWVGGGVVLAAVGDLAEVDAVAQHGDDRGVAPGPAGAGAVARAVERGGDRAGAVPLERTERLAAHPGIPPGQLRHLQAALPRGLRAAPRVEGGADRMADRGESLLVGRADAAVPSGQRVPGASGVTLLSTPVLPQAAVAAIAKDVQVYGHRGLETGGFLLLSRDADVVSTVAFAGDEGIVRQRNLFQISERALDRLFTFADDRDLWVPVQFHSHGAGAFLSLTDADHGLRAEGFTSAVIPGYRDPPTDIHQWGWWRFTAGRWGRVSGACVGDGLVELVRFDEVGVRGD